MLGFMKDCETYRPCFKYRSYIVPNGIERRLLISSRLRICRETVLVYIKLPSQRSSGEAKKNHAKTQDRDSKRMLTNSNLGCYYSHSNLLG
jgi:hypothetical protein